MAYQMTATAVTLNDLEGHSPIPGLLNCNPSNICAVFYTILTDSVLARFLSSTLAELLVLYGCEIWCMSPSDKHKVDVAWNNCFRKIFNACWRESVKPFLFYYNTMPTSLLVERRKMIFQNKTLHSSNIVLRILCALHRNEARKLSSVYHIFPGH